MAGFRKGGEAAIEAAAAASGGSKFPRAQYLTSVFNERDTDKVVLRYLTESPDWIWVDQHMSAPTKNKPADYQGTWPSAMPAVCRYDEAFKGIHSDCYIDDAGLTNQWGRPCKPSIRVWALACLREEVIGTQEMLDAGHITEDQVGKRLGFTDAVREVDERDEKGEPTGKKKNERAIVIVNMAPSNYFNGLQACYGAYDGTNCDRDYIVKKSGEGKDVDYTHIPLDPTPNLKPGSEKWARYEEAIKEQNLDLEAIIRDRASDDYFARFFDPNKTPAKKSDGEGSKSDKAHEVPAAADNSVDEDRLAKMRERVRGHVPAGAGVGSPEID